MKITLCGSMKFHAQMAELAASLEKQGHEVEVPQLLMEKEGDSGPEPQSIREFIEERGGINEVPKDHPVWQQKTDAIDDHFKKIAWADAILVANYPKRGVKGYIGGNTLMEMALAHYLKKPIFILHPVDAELSWAEEVLSMRPVVLGDDLSKIDAN